MLNVDLNILSYFLVMTGENTLYVVPIFWILNSQQDLIQGWAMNKCISVKWVGHNIRFPNTVTGDEID